MKKSVLFRIALVMLVLAMVTSCFVGGTFAKYVTEGGSEDDARVAIFGVNITGDANMFAGQYATDAENTTFEGEYSVKTGEAGGNLVAPGTKGSMTAITITGKPEVAVEVKYDATVTLNDNWKDKDGNFYCPLIIKINDTSIDGKAYNDKSVFLYDIEKAIESVNKQYAPNTNLSQIDGANMAISWEWPFSTSAENDVKDTYLGDQAADDSYGTVDVEVALTVTQID